MKIKGKSILYWLAHVPLALMVVVTLLAVGVGLWGMFLEAPYFMTGAIIFGVWMIWGFLYIRADEENHKDGS